MSNDVNLGYSKYGDGKAIIEILNIGFEPLLTPKEYRVYKKIGIMKKKIYHYEKSIIIIESNLLYIDECETRYKWLSNHLENNKYKLDKCIKIKKYAENIFRNHLSRNTKIKREIYDDREFKHEDQFRNIAIFESDLTRTFGCKDTEHSDDIISVVTYYTEIFDSVIHNGFSYKDIHFVFFTAGAGQTRNKKSTFVNKEKLNKHHDKLFCGLTMEKINELGGMNTNKFLAYTSLCQTNSEIWTDFDIDKAIVVKDIEFEIPNQKVRYIYTETPEDKLKIIDLKKELSTTTEELREIKLNKDNGEKRTKEIIKREKELKEYKKLIIDEIDLVMRKYHSSTIKYMDVVIPFTDGFGISFKKMESSMIRLPFIKGLIAHISKNNFKTYCSENEIIINEVEDIYGKYHSIDDIDYIFTESQFKMHKYFNNVLGDNDKVIKTGWEIYKDNFKKYNCDACRCNVENKVKLNAKTNYQILQTLTTEMTDRDIRDLATYDFNNLNGIGKDVQSMLNILGANEDKNNRMSHLQRALILYPEMLKDFYITTLLKNTKNSMIKKIKSGKFNINGSYIYAIPDTLACLQWWFTGERDLNKLGFVVGNGNVSCNLFEDGEELDCLRSPHLDHSHCIRINKKSEDIKKWMVSDGIYIGVNDIMSKVLMYDNDGDTLLVHNNKTIIKCAKSFQKKYGMIPNYYEMPKANDSELNNDTLYDGIVLAYHHGNIGTPSNEITKIFATLSTNSTKKEILEAIEIVALRCVDVNFTIDYAKTLYKPTIPKHISSRYKEYSGKKVPKFFMYAKNKTSKQVEEMDDGNIDRISNIIKPTRITFKNLLGKYTYKTLMTNPNVDIDTNEAKEIVELYRTIDEAKIRELSYIDLSMLDIRDRSKVDIQLEFNARRQCKKFVDYIGKPKEYIVDVLVKSLRNDINKDTLWKLFGDIIYSNIERNLENTKICTKCGFRFNMDYHNQQLCNTCSTYQPIGTKTIKCIESNCKNIFTVDARNMTKVRCDECQKVIDKEKTRLRVQKFRNNNKM